MVTAVSPAQALNKVYLKLEKELKARIDSYQSTIFTLQESLESVYWQQRLGISPEEIIEPLKDLNSMEFQTIKIISNAEKYIMIFAGSFDWCEKVRVGLIKALNSGVSVMVMMRTTTPDSIKRAKNLIKDGIQVKRYKENWYPIRGTLADGNKLVFLIWATKKDVKKPIHFRPNYTTNSGLITIFSDAFHTKWSEAESID
jgi:sugar-specific transcriptional regulator TrmB